MSCLAQLYDIMVSFSLLKHDLYDTAFYNSLEIIQEVASDSQTACAQICLKLGFPCCYTPFVKKQKIDC